MQSERYDAKLERIWKSPPPTAPLVDKISCLTLGTRWGRVFRKCFWKEFLTLSISVMIPLWREAGGSGGGLGCGDGAAVSRQWTTTTTTLSHWLHNPLPGALLCILYFCLRNSNTNKDDTNGHSQYLSPTNSLLSEFLLRHWWWKLGVK